MGQLISVNEAEKTCFFLAFIESKLKQRFLLLLRDNLSQLCEEFRSVLDILIISNFIYVIMVIDGFVDIFFFGNGVFFIFYFIK